MKEIQSGQSHEVFMERCLELATNGLGQVAPNPMVGAVIVHEGLVIGEGFHRQFGKPHAEVNAIKSVSDSTLLKESTLYVNLEPCSHTGKTPPCSDFIIQHKIPKVVIGTSDPNPLVAGEGIDRLTKSGVKVESNILPDKCRELNRRFYTYYIKKRPYIILKWAQTTDGFIDIKRLPGESASVNWISNPLSRMLVHKWRSEEQGIMVGTTTVLTDNPALTVREWSGKNPIRIIPDRNLRIPAMVKIFDNSADTLIVNERQMEIKKTVEWIKIRNEGNDLKVLLEVLYQRQIQSLIVEGGKKLLEYFIDRNLWDEARVITGEKKFYKGLEAPRMNIVECVTEKFLSDTLSTFRNKSAV